MRKLGENLIACFTRSKHVRQDCNPCEGNGEQLACLRQIIQIPGGAVWMNMAPGKLQSCPQGSWNPDFDYNFWVCFNDKKISVLLEWICFTLF